MTNFYTYQWAHMMGFTCPVKASLFAIPLALGAIWLARRPYRALAGGWRADGNQLASYAFPFVALPMWALFEWGILG